MNTISSTCKSLVIFLMPLILLLVSQSFAVVTEDDLEYNYNATGSIDRLVFDKLAETVSVKDFGAKGDNINNDTEEIQAAINYLQDSNLTGYVKFPPGRYRIYSPIVVSGDGITLIGEGQTTASATYKCVFIQNLAATDAFQITGNYSGIDNLLIYKADTRTAGVGINFSNCTGSFARRIYLGYLYDGINISNCTDIDLYDIDILELYGTYGIRIAGTSDSITKNVTLRRIKTSHSSSTTFNGLRIVDYVDDVDIDNGRFIRGGIGVWITAGDTSTGYPKNIRTYQMGTDNTNQEGYKIEAGSDIFSENTWIGQVGAAGSEYSGVTIGSGVKGNITFSNWYVRGARQHGINIQGGKNIVLTNCLVGQNNTSNGAYDGIYIADGVSDVTITGGKCGYLEGGGANNQKYGINIAGSNHYNISMQGVNLYGNVTGYLKDDSLSTSGNFIRNNIGPNNPTDATMRYYKSGAVANARYLVQWIYGQKIKLTHVNAKLASGTCTIYVSYSGVSRSGAISVSSTASNNVLSSPIEIDATTTPVRVEVYVTGQSSANGLELGYGFTNMH